MVLTPEPTTQPPVLERVRQSVRFTSGAGGVHKLLFNAMNTLCRVDFQCPSLGQARAFQAEVVDWVAAFEARYSRFLPDSIVSRINAAAGREWVSVDPETERLLALCGEMVFLTRGVFEPTALPLMRLWNWKSNPPRIPLPAEVEAARALVGWRKVQRKPGQVFLSQPGMALDFGGIGKEYAVDCVLTMGLRQGIVNILVDFGQDVRVHGHPPERGAWHIGLEDPVRPGKCWAGVGVDNHAVASSGDYIRNFVAEGRRYGHIIDPRTGEPVDNGCLCVNIVANTCTLAGILSTSAFILGPKEGVDLIQICQGAEGSITCGSTRYQSRNFHAYIVS